MVAGKVVLSGLIAIGKWVANNPTVVKDAANVVAKLKPGKTKKDDNTPTVDEKLNQLGTVAFELDQKVDAEVSNLRSELEKVHKQMRSMRTMMTVIGAVLGVAIIAIILLAIL